MKPIGKMICAAWRKLGNRHPFKFSGFCRLCGRKKPNRKGVAA